MRSQNGPTICFLVQKSRMLCGVAVRVHVFVLSQVLLAMILQVSVGRLKHISLMTGVIDARNRGKKFRWHGKARSFVL